VDTFGKRAYRAMASQSRRNARIARDATRNAQSGLPGVNQIMHRFDHMASEWVHGLFASPDSHDALDLSSLPREAVVACMASKMRAAAISLAFAAHNELIGNAIPLGYGN